MPLKPHEIKKVKELCNIDVEKWSSIPKDGAEYQRIKDVAIETGSSVLRRILGRYVTDHQGLTRELRTAKDRAYARGGHSREEFARRRARLEERENDTKATLPITSEWVVSW